MGSIIPGAVINSPQAVSGEALHLLLTLIPFACSCGSFCGHLLKPLSVNMSLVCLKPQLSPTYLMPKFDRNQLQLLEELFDRNKNPMDSELEILAHEGGLSLFDIKVWFEHQLALFRQSQGFPANMRRISEL